MKRSILIAAFLFFTLLSCKKDADIPLSGTVTIDNTLFGTGPYYANGFSFSKAAKVSSLSDPGPDITLVATLKIDGTIDQVSIQSENFKSSFYMYGQYTDSQSAVMAFNSLLSATVSEGQWDDWAIPVEDDQVWIFRTLDEKYVKFRIISVTAEQRDGKPFAECTLEWVYQPDGTLTFPGE